MSRAEASAGVLPSIMTMSNRPALGNARAGRDDPDTWLGGSLRGRSVRSMSVSFSELPRRKEELTIKKPLRHFFRSRIVRQAFRSGAHNRYETFPGFRMPPVMVIVDSLHATNPIRHDNGSMFFTRSGGTGHAGKDFLSRGWPAAT